VCLHSIPIGVQMTSLSAKYLPQIISFFFPFRASFLSLHPFLSLLVLLVWLNSFSAYLICLQYIRVLLANSSRYLCISSRLSRKWLRCWKQWRCFQKQDFRVHELKVISLYIFIFNFGALSVPLTVAAKSKAWTVFAHLNTGIVGSNPTQGMDVFVRLFCV
jgi:hypothetical protein